MRALHIGFVFAIILLSSMGIITNNAWASEIAPGFDLFTTDPGTTSIDFAVSPLPADFFCPGSPPFVGIVDLEGIPLGTENVDTIVERKAGINPLPVPAGSDTIAIELVALNLKSVSPIVVTGCAVDPQDWDLEVVAGSFLAVPQPLGTMTINHEFTEGGTFVADFQVQPEFIFLKVGEPTTFIQLQGPPDNLHSESSWAHTGHCNDPHNSPFRAGDFFAGFNPITGLSVLTQEMGAFANHGVFPTGGPCPSPVGGNFIPLDSTMILVAGTHSVAAWMIPVIVSAIGIGIVIARKF